jgi:RimJ/RimL family protein N-acetyltransferase
MVEVRRLGDDDWARLRDLRLAALADAPYAFASTVESEAELDEWQWRDRLVRAAWFAALDDARLVGLVGAFREESGDLHLIGMWVAPGARGTGLAARLVESLLSWARGQHTSGVVLWVADGNDRARRLYQALGFTATGLRQPLPSNPSIGETQYRLAL